MAFRVSARTVLELGSELISSDIIAFYELIKNAFDARSRSGADVYFRIALRRNEYLRIRERALGIAATVEVSEGLNRKEAAAARTKHVAELVESVRSKLDLSVAPETREQVMQTLASAGDIDEFVELLDGCYENFNSIEVADTGVGMSEVEVRDNFLTLGTPARKREVDKAIETGAGKVPLGEKGIGRLSTMRLGNRLHVETARVEDPNMTWLDIDWRAFEDLNALIEDIDIAPVKGPIKESAKWHGTRLVIKGVLEDWTEKRVRELADYDFARLLDPFRDPKNRSRIAIHWNDERIAIPWVDSSLIDNAHASLKGAYVVLKGEPTLTLSMVATKLGNFEHPSETDVLVLARPDLEALLAGADGTIPDTALTSVGNFDFEIYWYNRRYITSIESIGNQAAVRAALKKWSSVMLFRDGFRVFPYGEQADDWLSLDAIALGRTGYVLNKNQFVGHVRISRAGNPRLVDQTNREGLRETPESYVFREVLHDAVVERLWSFFKDVDRRYRNRAEDLGEIRKEVEVLEGRTKTALKKLRKIVPKEEIGVLTDVELAIDEFEELAKRAERRAEQVEADSKQMVQMAGVGLLVEMVAHELARSTESALTAIEGLHGKDLPSDVRSKLDTLRSEIKSVSKRLRVLDQASVPGRQRSEVFDLVKLIEDIKDGHSSQFARHHVGMRIKGPKAPVKVKLVKGMVVQILENLIANSVYWMKVRSTREASYQPEIEVRVELDPLTIHFSDNGRGIAPDHQERVFRAYWSLKESSKRRGLGLFIAASNATDLKGRLTLSDRRDKQTGRLHEFLLELPDTAIVT